jgi:hypothetical protein
MSWCLAATARVHRSSLSSRQSVRLGRWVLWMELEVNPLHQRLNWMKMYSSPKQNYHIGESAMRFRGENSWGLTFVSTTGYVGHCFLAAITMVLVMIGYIKTITSKDCRILMAWVWMRWRLCTGWSVLCIRLDKWRRQHKGDFSLGGVFLHQVSIFGVKTLGLTFTGCTWQWRICIRFLVEGIAWSLFRLSSGWKSMICWSGDDGVLCTVSLLEASFIEEPFL